MLDAVHNDHRKARCAYQDELAVITGQLAAKNPSFDKYLADFENDALSRDLLARRVAQLNDEIEQLRHRRDALRLALDVEPDAPDDATLDQVREHLAEIIRTADLPEQQALCEALIEALQVRLDGVATPVLRIPTRPRPAPPQPRQAA